MPSFEAPVFHPPPSYMRYGYHTDGVVVLKDDLVLPAHLQPTCENMSAVEKSTVIWIGHITVNFSTADRTHITTHHVYRTSSAYEGRCIIL